MNVSVISVFKQLYEPFFATSLIKRAQEKGIVSFQAVSFSDFVLPKERIDAPTFGPGAGMLIKPEVVKRAIERVEKDRGTAYKIFLSPQGQLLDQPLLQTIVHKAQEVGHLMFIASRYEGMDARVEAQYADMTISLGNFVLMGGDIPTMAIIEGMLRLIPGVVGKQESVEQESFSGPFLDYPEYTEPVEWQGMAVPEIVRSGNHAAIEAWRTEQAVANTVRTHFDWLRSFPLNAEQRAAVRAAIPSHYMALMHYGVLVGPDCTMGTTSVMSIDIHDIARACATYGVEKFFIVTPLIDQQKIIEQFFSFWRSDIGIAYNTNRHEALNVVQVIDSLDLLIAQIEKKEGKTPIIVGTSARTIDQKTISFHDQGLIWGFHRPVLFLLGTGQGLSPLLLDRCDYILNPIHGLTNFNHLSVRSATAVILDRWMGLHERGEKKLPE